MSTRATRDTLSDCHYKVTVKPLFVCLFVETNVQKEVEALVFPLMT